MRKLIYSVLLTLVLAGCASPNVPLSPGFWKNHHQRIAVTTNKVPKAGLYQEGQEGLLDFVINSGVTEKFRHYLASYPLSKLSKSLLNNFVKRLHANKIKAYKTSKIDVVDLYDTGLDKTKFATKDYTQLRVSVGSNKLLIVTIDAVGATRKYYSFIPLGSPKAFCNLEGHLVNLKNNRILWRYTAKAYVPVIGAWDQPPNYPNFNVALNQAVELSKQEVLDNFFYANKS